MELALPNHEVAIEALFSLQRLADEFYHIVHYHNDDDEELAPSVLQNDCP